MNWTYFDFNNSISLASFLFFFPSHCHCHLHLHYSSICATSEDNPSSWPIHLELFLRHYPLNQSVPLSQQQKNPPELKKGKNPTQFQIQIGLQFLFHSFSLTFSHCTSSALVSLESVFAFVFKEVTFLSFLFLNFQINSWII